MINLLWSEQLCKRFGILLSVILSVSSFCSGCGRERLEKVPKLIEPVAINSSYRPVEKGSIGDIEVLFGTVMPKQYCSFFLTGVKCSEITVQIGDCVKKGDVVAYADVDSSREALKSLQEELAHENKIYEIENDILEESKKQSEFVNHDKSGNDITENKTSKEIVGINKQTAIYDEDIRYNRLMHEYRVDKLKEEIDVLQQIVDDGVLRASHDGNVTYVKNISYEPEAQPMENIVIISDTEDLYIELKDNKIDTYKYGDYEDKYINISGERNSVEEIPYSSEEMIQAKICGRYPNVRFEFPNNDAINSMKIGDTCPVYFVKNSIEDITIIAKDSLYEENGEYYVYVYGEGNKREKRKITIGSSDKNYVQVTEGLGEGELVYYESDRRMPSDYNTYKINLSDFEIKNHSKTYELSNEYHFKYNSEREGKINKFSVADGDSVKKGDLLYTIDIGEGKAAMAEAQNNINREKKSHKSAIKELKKELKKYEDKEDDYSVSQTKIIHLKMDKAKEEHAYNFKQLQNEYDRIEKDNDGAGIVSVYAEDSGVVRNIKFVEGDYVAEGEEVLSIGIATKDKLLVYMRKIDGVSVDVENIADIGERVFIEDGNTIYEGKCTGWTVNSENNEDKNYVSSDNKNTYLSFSTSSGYPYPAFYVEMKDVSFYNDMPTGKLVTFSYIYMQDVVAVPKKYVNTEILEQDEECSYVWKLAGKTIVKQYVLVDDDLEDETDVVILSGVKEGDVLVSE